MQEKKLCVITFSDDLDGHSLPRPSIVWQAVVEATEAEAVVLAARLNDGLRAGDSYAGSYDVMVVPALVPIADADSAFQMDSCCIAASVAARRLDEFVFLWNLSFPERLPGSADVRSSLAARYAEPHRAYHNASHILHCIKELSSLRVPNVSFDDRNLIEAALWYHDAIYDTQAKDNEERSAELAVQDLATMGWSESRIARVRAMILATKHTGAPTDLLTQLLVDVDLSILGQPASVFDTYEESIRKEYEWVPLDVYCAHRAAFLEGMRARPRIFSTATMHDRYDTAARENIARSVAKLRT